MEVKKVKFQDIPEIGRAIYKDEILPTLGPDDDGKLVVIDVTTGNYEIDGRDIDLCMKLLEPNPEALTWAERVGRPAVVSLGGGSGLPSELRLLS